MNSIEVNNLSVIQNNQDILKNISFTLEKGSFLNIIGPNGGGKSTLIETIVGLNKSYTGNFVINEKNINYLPQEVIFKNNFPITVKEVLNLEVNKLNKDEYIYWLNKLNLNDLLNKNINALSGGEKKRIFFMRSLLNKPNLLILDEPISALDNEYKNQLLNILVDLNNNGMTIINVTHDLVDLNINCKTLKIDKEIKYYGLTKNYLNKKEVR